VYAHKVTLLVTLVSECSFELPTPPPTEVALFAGSCHNSDLWEHRLSTHASRECVVWARDTTRLSCSCIAPATRLFDRDLAPNGLCCDHLATATHLRTTIQPSLSPYRYRQSTCKHLIHAHTNAQFSHHVNDAARMRYCTVCVCVCVCVLLCAKLRTRDDSCVSCLRTTVPRAVNGSALNGIKYSCRSASAVRASDSNFALAARGCE
jgi:hypothetical protein